MEVVLYIYIYLPYNLMDSVLVNQRPQRILRCVFCEFGKAFDCAAQCMLWGVQTARVTAASHLVPLSKSRVSLARMQSTFKVDNRVTLSSFCFFVTFKGSAEVWRESSSLTFGCYLFFVDDTVLLASTNRDR